MSVYCPPSPSLSDTPTHSRSAVLNFTCGCASTSTDSYELAFTTFTPLMRRVSTHHGMTCTTEDNRKYLVVVSNKGWPVIFSVINLGGGKVRAAEDGTDYASLADVVRAMRDSGLSSGKEGERIRPLKPLDGCFFHRSAAWAICKQHKIRPQELAVHAWFVFTHSHIT